MKQLIENDPKIINATNYSNQAPLHLAAKSGHEEVFHILKIFDANDFKDNGGKTAEDYAHEQGHRDKFNIEYLALYSWSIMKMNNSRLLKTVETLLYFSHQHLIYYDFPIFLVRFYVS